MPLQWEIFARLFLIAVFSTNAIAQIKPSDDALIADFEAGHSFTIGVKGASATTSSDGAAQGQKYLRIVPAQVNAYVRLGMPEGTSFVDRERLTAHVRAARAAGVGDTPVALTWMALNDKQQPIFLCTVKLDPAETWTELDVPIRFWRWPEGRVGDWDEVKAIALRIDSESVDHIDLDDIRLEETAPAEERTNWLLDLAFEGRQRRVASGDDFLIATDAVEGFAEADLKQLMDDVTRARKFIRRVFGEVVRPTEQIASPAMLLIFSSEESRHAFLDRLGQAWGAKIRFGGSQGFTLHDIATTTYVQKLGVRRPVYLHEGVHALVARDLRLMPGLDQQGLLQEAIANYIQLCVHPTAIAPDVYPKAFAQPLDGKGIFKPLQTLFSGRVTTKDYAQLASLFAYLVEKDPTLLSDVTSAVAAGGTVQDVLARRGLTFDALQEAWLAWGRERFKRTPAAGDPIFERPVEFR